MSLRIKAVLSWFLFVGAVKAGEHSELEDGVALKEYGIGILFSKVPDYRGTKHINQFILPFPYIIYRGKVLDVDDEGVKGIIYKSDNLELDLGYAGTIPVLSKNIAAREGMKDLDPTAQVGPQLKILHLDRPNLKIETRMPVRVVASFGAKKIAYQGWVFDPYVLVELKTKARNFNLSWSHFFGPIFADQDFHGYYYNVEAPDATSTRPVYHARTGYSGYKYTSSFNGWRGRWGYGAFFRYDSMRSAVFRDSPLVETQVNLTGGIGLIYLFYSESKF